MQNTTEMKAIQRQLQFMFKLLDLSSSLRYPNRWFQRFAHVQHLDIDCRILFENLWHRSNQTSVTNVEETVDCGLIIIYSLICDEFRDSQLRGWITMVTVSEHCRTRGSV
jgi:hypothetical protein